MTERQRKIVQVARQACNNGDCLCGETVTVTLRREDAESLWRWIEPAEPDEQPSHRIVEALTEALEARA